MGLQVPLLAQEQSWAQSCPKCPPAHTVGTGQPGTYSPTRSPQTTTHSSCSPGSSQVTAVMARTPRSAWDLPTPTAPSPCSGCT